MPRPSPGHLRLEELAEIWKGEETLYPSQWDPKGGVAIGRNRHRMSLGGFALIVDYEQERDAAITFTGHGVYTYDPDEGLYTLHWFDCMGSPPEVFVGGFDGDVLALADGGPVMHARLTCDLSSPGVLKGMMEMSPDGPGWMILLKATHRLS